MDITDCLNRIDNMIFNKNLKYKIINYLEIIRIYIQRQQAEINNIMSVLSQITYIIERI